MTDRSSETSTSVTDPAEERPDPVSEEPTGEPTGEEAPVHNAEEAEPAAEATPTPEPADSPGSGESPNEVPSASTGPDTGSSVRLSQPTPTLPPALVPEKKDDGLSEFFDTLDDRFAEATGKIASAFRRPEPGEQISARIDPQLELIYPVEPDEPQGPSPEDTDLAAPKPPEPAQPGQQHPGDAPDVEFAEVEAPSAPPQIPARLEEEWTDDVDLPDEETASQLAAMDEDTQLLPPVPAVDPQATRISLPGPPRRDSRPLPWDAKLQQSEDARQQDASAARRRAVILEKASAIEAATGREASNLDDYADEEDDLYTYVPPYNLPSRDPDPAPRARDLARQIHVSLGAVAAVVASLWMLGVIGGPAILGDDALGTLVEGWYSGERALLTPAAHVYWLWPLISLGLLGHAVHQWTTRQISTPRQRRSGWLVGTASILVLIWTAAVHAGLLTLAVLAALATALALIDAIRQFTFHTARNTAERRLTDAVVGVFTGWALVHAMSSISVALTAMGVHIPGFPATLWAMIGLVGCIWVGAFYAMTERGRMTIALGLGWGMFWLVFPRLLSEVPSVWVAIGAAMGAFIVILATESRRHRINHAERRAAMGRPVDDII